MLLNFERYFFPDKPDLYVIAFTTRLPKIKKKSLKHLRNEKSLRLIIMILTLYVQEKLPTVVRKLPGKNKIN